MTGSRINSTAALGATATAAGLLATLTGHRKLSGLATIGAGLAAALAMRTRAEAEHLEQRVSAMNEQIRQLENAVAAQVQNRMAAEETVKSLGDQLSAAEKRLGEASNTIVLSDSGVGGESLTDPLTGLFNHEYFLVTLDARIAAARRHLRPVAIALVQVVEGREGPDRPPADPIIVADALRQTLRESDTATRLGDGRFGVVLEDTPENGAIWTVERIRRCLAEHDPNVTLWAGVACYPAHAFDMSALIERAEVALRSAQEWHQDRIEIATAE